MYDLVIIGAGPAGSSLAAVLAGLGWRVLLLERQQLPQHKVCGEFLSPEAWGSLQAMDLDSVVLALQPATMTHARLVARSGAQLRIALPGVAWGISRFALDAALAQAAAQRGALLQTGMTATALQRGDTSYTIMVRDAQGRQTQVAARAAVLACGRQLLPGLRSTPVSQPARQYYVGVKCHYSGLRSLAEVQLYTFAGGYIGLSPIEQGLSNVCMLIAQEVFKQAGGRVASSIAYAAQLNARLGQALVGGYALTDTEVAVAAVDTARVPQLWGYCAQLGDAAAMIPPLCGDGMAMALRAAEITAPLADEFLRGRRSLTAWQLAYEIGWRQEFQRPLWIGRRLQTLLGVPMLDGALLRFGALCPGLASGFVHATRGPQRARTA